LIGTENDDVTCGGDAPRRYESGQEVLQPGISAGVFLPDVADVVEALREQIGQCRDIAFGLRLNLPIVIGDLNEGAKADRNQEGDDECRDCPPQRRFGNQQPMIGRFRNRLRQSLDRIGLDACALYMRARHALAPLDFPLEHRPPQSCETCLEQTPAFTSQGISRMQN
jgi:hypothetical protein